MSRLIPFVLLATACASTPSKPAEPPPAPRVTLTFNWPDGLRASVKSTGTRTRPNRPATELNGTSTIRVERRGGEVWVHTEASQATGDEAAQMLSGLPMPAQVADADGQFLRLEGTGKTIDALIAKLPGMRQPSQRPALEKLLADTLQQGSRDEWNVQVGVWAGHELVLGQPVQATTEAKVPSLGTGLIKFDVTLTAHERVACRTGEPELRCVRLSLHSVPDMEDVRRAAPAMVKTIQAAAGRDVEDGMQIMKLEIVNDAELIAEPETLLPHRLTQRRRTAVTIQLGDQSQTMESSDVTRYAYQYR